MAGPTTRLDGREMEGARTPPRKAAHTQLRRRAAGAPPGHGAGERAQGAAGPARRDGASASPRPVEAPPDEPRAGRAEGSSALFRLALCAWLAYSLYSVLLDLLAGGLGDSNSKFVSFLASVASCVDFRLQKRQQPRSPAPFRARAFSSDELSSFHAGAPCRNWLTRAPRVLAGNLWAKFGSATVGSLLVRETPVLLKGPRHAMTFVVALLAVQLCPGDLLFRAVTSSKAFQLVLRLSAALYKLRKLVFVTLACRAIAQSSARPPLLGAPGSAAHLAATAAYACLVAWVINDGSSNLRAVDNWLRWRGFPRSRHAGGHLRARALLLQEAALGLLWAADRFRNLAALSVAMVLADADRLPTANLLLRALALLVLLKRHKVDAALSETCAQLWGSSSEARLELRRRSGQAAARLAALAPAAAVPGMRRRARQRPAAFEQSEPPPGAAEPGSEAESERGGAGRGGAGAQAADAVGPSGGVGADPILASPVSEATTDDEQSAVGSVAADLEPPMSPLFCT